MDSLLTTHEKSWAKSSNWYRRKQHDPGRRVRGRVEIFLTIRMLGKYYPTLTCFGVISFCKAASGQLWLPIITFGSYEAAWKQDWYMTSDVIFPSDWCIGILNIWHSNHWHSSFIDKNARKVNIFALFYYIWGQCGKIIVRNEGNRRCTWTAESRSRIPAAGKNTIKFVSWISYVYLEKGGIEYYLEPGGQDAQK